MAFTGVAPLDASLSHSFKRGPYEGSERDFPGRGQKIEEGKFHFSLDNDSYFLYKFDRLVGFIPFDRFFILLII